MIAPDEILKKQVCSICFKYLSVGPVKVYPNRQVKCGRCSQEDDGGTESLLYKTIANCVQFPCINRFDGCKVVSSTTDMKYHENDCKEEENGCPLCADFKGSGYDLNLHLQRHHKKETLHASAFFIDLHEGGQEDIYFYEQDTILYFITYRYDAVVHMLYLNIAFAGTRYNGRVTQMFTLHNSNDELKHKTDILPCSNIALAKIGDFEFQIDLYSLEFNGDTIICKFCIKEEPILELQQSSQVIDSTNDCAVIRCRFNYISAYTDEDNFNYHPERFVVNGFTFKVGMKLDETGTRIDLDGTCSKDQQCCNVFAKFTLISSHSREHFVIKKGEFSYNENSCPVLLSGEFDKTKTDLLNPENGFAENDSVLVEIRCQVQVSNKKLCIYCNSCKKCNNPVKKEEAPEVI